MEVVVAVGVKLDTWGTTCRNRKREVARVVFG